MLSEEMMHLVPASLQGKEDILFGNLHELYTFHNEIFLKDLENCISTTELVALCFVQRVSRNKKLSWNEIRGWKIDICRGNIMKTHVPFGLKFTNRISVIFLNFFGSQKYFLLFLYASWCANVPLYLRKEKIKITFRTLKTSGLKSVFYYFLYYQALLKTWKYHSIYNLIFKQSQESE